MIWEGELYHHGILGMKWGVRRYQNKDGSLTSAGKKRVRLASVSERLVRGHAGPSLTVGSKRSYERDKKDLELLNNGGHLSIGLTKKRQEAYDKRDKKALEKRIADYENGQTEEKKGLSDKQKTAIKIGAAAVGTALVAYGAYKVSKKIDAGISKEARAKGEEILKRASTVNENFKRVANEASVKREKASLLMSEAANYNRNGNHLKSKDLRSQASQISNEASHLAKSAESLNNLRLQLGIEGSTAINYANKGRYSIKEKAAYLKSKKG